MDRLITENLPAIRRLCKEHSVEALDVFGSVLGNHFTDTSDVDFLVVFSRREGTNAFHQFFEFKEALSRLLQREVELVCYRAIQNPVFKKEVESTRKSLYAA